MKSRRLWSILGLISILAAISSLTCCAPAGDTVRVGLVRFYRGAQSVTVSSSSGITLTNANGQELVSCEPGVSVTLSAEGGAVTVRSGLEVQSASGQSVTASPGDPASTIRVESLRQPAREYRGAIEVRPKPWGLLVVNVVSVEDYLLGVVPEEMPSGYPIEAINAQAVTARTYALSNHSKHASDGYDLCDTNNCQTYGGVSAEKPSSTEAVNATRGLVLTYGGKVASVMYSTDCGGATQDCSETRPTSKLPYLCSVTEPAEMPHCSWEAAFSIQDLQDKLVAAGVKQAAGLTSIKVSKTGASGRAIEFEVTGSQGAATVTGLKLRAALGMSVIKSLLLTIEQTPDGGVVFRGKGFGHGVGLCQAGARWLASPPRNNTYDQILAHYFPGTEIAIGAKHSDSALSEQRKPDHLNASPLQTVRQSPTATDQRKVEVKPAPSTLPKKPDGRGGVTFDVRLDASDGL